MKLDKIITISGRIHLHSGLHIGAGGGTMEIGGLDQPIIKHPLSSAPYIPGSSLKGKLRSLLELATGKLSADGKGKPCDCRKADCKICRMFGPHSAEERSYQGPTRLLVRDGNLTEKWKNKFQSGELPMEFKYENIINRISGTAKDPRPLERVPAGVEFDLSMSLRIFDEDKTMNLRGFLLEGMVLMEADALGGCGSRGSGQITFKGLQSDGETFDLDPTRETLRTNGVS